MVIFEDKFLAHHRYLWVCLDETRSRQLVAVDRKWTKIRSRPSINELEKEPYAQSPTHPPCWSDDVGGQILLRSGHAKAKEPILTYNLLIRDIDAKRRSWGQLSLAGEFRYEPLYWEWLEDVLVRWQVKLEHFGLYSALYASMFLYDKCPNLVRAVCEQWCPETNTIHTNRGEVSISLLDIQQLLGLPASGLLYDEVVPSRRTLLSSEVTCKHLFTAYHILYSRGNKRPTLSNWISFWFVGRRKYQDPAKSDPTTKFPHPDHKPSDGCQGWKGLQATFNMLGVKDVDRTDTYLAAFLSCWLCKFILPIRESGLIRPGVFLMASGMAAGKQYCLSTPILASLYKGLNVISRSPTPVRSGAPFPAHFLYAWLSRYFPPVYKASNKTFSDLGMDQFSGLGEIHNFDLDTARKIITFRKSFRWHNCIYLRSKEHFVDDAKLSTDNFSYFASIRSGFLCYRSEDSYVMERYCPDRFSRQFGFHQDIPRDLDFTVKPSPEALRELHAICIRSGTGSKATLPGFTTSARRMVTNRFQEWWSRHFSAPVLNASCESSKRKRDDSDAPGDCKSRDVCTNPATLMPAKPPRVVASSAAGATTVNHGLELGIATTPGSGYSILKKARKKTTVDQEKRPIVEDQLVVPSVMEMPPKGADNILHVLDFPSSGFTGDSGGGDFQEGLAKIPLPSGPCSFGEFSQSLGLPSQNEDEEVTSTGLPKATKACRQLPPLVPRIPRAEVSVFPTNEVIKTAVRNLGETVIQKISKTSFESLHHLVSDFDPIYFTIREMGFDPSPLQAKVDETLRKVCDFGSLRQSLPLGTTANERETQLKGVDKKIAIVSSQLDANESQLCRWEKEFAEVSRELQSLQARHRELESRVSEGQAKISSSSGELALLQKQRVLIDATPAINSQVKLAVEMAESCARDAFEELKKFRWEP